MNPAVTYLSPAWGLVPTKEHSGRYDAVHVVVTFGDADTGPVTIHHNLELPFGAPLAEPDWMTPLILVNLLSGGPAAPLHTVNPIDGNSISFGRVASGPGTAAVYDVRLYRGHKPSWFEK